MFYSSEDAEEFYDYENNQDIYEKLKEFYDIDDNIKEINSFNSIKPVFNEKGEINQDENYNEIEEHNLFDIKLDYKVKKNIMIQMYWDIYMNLSIIIKNS